MASPASRFPDGGMPKNVGRTRGSRRWEPSVVDLRRGKSQTRSTRAAEPGSSGATGSTAPDVLRAALAAGLRLGLNDGGDRIEWEADQQPPEALLAAIRAVKPHLVEIRNGDRCRRCGKPLDRPRPVGGVVLGDQTAQCLPCGLRSQLDRPSAHSQEPRGAPATAAPAWTDDREWCRRIGAAGLLDARRVVLREWVDAAGGWSDAAAVHLPDSLPNGLALATLKAHARALGLADACPWRPNEAPPPDDRI